MFENVGKQEGGDKERGTGVTEREREEDVKKKEETEMGIGGHERREAKIDREEGGRDG